MTITATPNPTFSPPRVEVEIAVPIAGGRMESVTVWRRQNGIRELLRQQPAAGLDERLVVDYEARYEVPCTYEWEARYFDPTLFTTLFSEAWASTASWTLSGTWAVSAGTAILTSTTGSITRTFAAGRYQVQLDQPPAGIGMLRLSPLPTTTTGTPAISLDFRSSRIRYGTQSAPFVRGTGQILIDVTPTGITVTTTAGVYTLTIPNPQVSRLQFLDPYVEYGAIVELADLAQAGMVGPSQVAVDEARGWIYVVDASDTAAFKARRFDMTTGALLASWITTGSGTNQSAEGCRAVAVAADGTIYTTAQSATGIRIQKWAPGATGTSTPTLTTSWAVATSTSVGDVGGELHVDKAGKVWFAYRDGVRVQRYSNTGTLELTIGGTAGDANNQFRDPISVAVVHNAGLTSSTVFVADNYSNVIKKFDGSTGAVYDTPEGGTGTTAGRLSFPRSITVNRAVYDDQPFANGVFVADGRARIQDFDNGYTEIVMPSDASAPFVFSSIASTATNLYVKVAAGPTGKLYRVPLIRPRVYPLTVRSYGATNLAIAEQTDPVTLAPAEAWLIHPARPGVSVPVFYDDLTRPGLFEISPVSQPANATVHRILGQQRAIVVSTGPRGADEFSLELEVASPADRLAIQELIRDETPVLLRVPPSWGVDIDEGYFAIGTVSVARQLQFYGQTDRIVRLPLLAVDAPLVEQENVGWSFASLASTYASFEAVAAAFRSYSDLSANDPVEA